MDVFKSKRTEINELIISHIAPNVSVSFECNEEAHTSLSNDFVTNNFRNNIIQKLVKNLNTNTLILVDRIVHGEYLLNFLQATLDCKQIFFIQGSVDVQERENVRQIMENQTGIVCIAISKIFSTGISIKNLHNVVFAAIGKARIKIIQSIGRSLRLHETKDIATIFDIADNNLTYGNKHYTERKEIYTNEQIPLLSKIIVE